MATLIVAVGGITLAGIIGAVVTNFDKVLFLIIGVLLS